MMQTQLRTRTRTPTCVGRAREQVPHGDGENQRSEWGYCHGRVTSQGVQCILCIALHYFVCLALLSRSK